MDRLTHGFRIDQDKCRGCLSCMRVCPTRAIRVKNGKAHYQPDRCIDCGVCLPACPSGAIIATTWSPENFSRFKFKVAVPSPVLFAQLPSGVTPTQIVEALLTIGFDVVWDYSVEIGLVARAIREYVENWKGSFPLVSVDCPVVVRLVQVAYPRMVDQLINVQLPREIAGREIKRKYSRELGLAEDEIAAIYITPCQAKTISILQPAEEVESYLDGALGISEVYNAIVAYANLHKSDIHKAHETDPIRSSTFLRWPLGEGVRDIYSRQRSLVVTGLPNITQVFNDIENGKLRNVDFIHAYSCWSGCPGGNLTVANLYVTLSKIRSMIGKLPEMDAGTEAEIVRRFPTERFTLDRPLRPRLVRGATGSLKERVRVVQEAETLLKSLPGLNCGLCGAPTCKELARDISLGDAARTDCLFLSSERLLDLQRRYLKTEE